MYYPLIPSLYYPSKNFNQLLSLEQYMLSLRNTQSLPLNVSTDEFVDTYIKDPALKIKTYEQLFKLIDIIIDYGITRNTIIDSFVNDLIERILAFNHQIKVIYDTGNTNISNKYLMREYQACHLPAIIKIYQQYMPQALNALKKECANYQNSSGVAEIESKINTTLSILETPLLQQGPLPQAPLPSKVDTSDNEKLFTQSLLIFQTGNTVKEIRNQLNAHLKKNTFQKNSDNNSEQKIDPASLKIIQEIDLTTLRNPVITIKKSNVRDTCFLQIRNLFNIASLSIIFFYILTWRGSSINSTIFGT